MSAAEQLFLPFDELDIENASKNDVPEPRSAILALSDTLSYVDPAFFGDDIMHYENEQRFVAMRQEWLAQADDYFNQQSYSSCVSVLRLVLEDIQHAGYFDESVVEAVTELIELCYEYNRRAKGSAALAEVVAIPDTVVPSDEPIIHQIAS